MSVLFLDIDGVLNGHNFLQTSMSNLIQPHCVNSFNFILAKANPEIVLSSSWRYMISGGAQTLKGFEYMLRTHGVLANINIIGYTPLDEEIPERGRQIERWLLDHPDKTNYAIVDDNMYELDFRPVEERVVFTNGLVGLTDTEAEKLIRLLNA